MKDVHPAYTPPRVYLRKRESCRKRDLFLPYERERILQEERPPP